jgi:hypothetical protein
MNPGEFVICSKLSLDKSIGYIYFIDKSHPLADSVGKVLHHRHVASVSLGHWLSTGEHVHHIDGNRVNNDPLNLEVKTHAEHAREHAVARYAGHTARIACDNCGSDISRAISAVSEHNYCNRSCVAAGNTTTAWPAADALRELVWTMPATHVAAKLGISSVTVKQRCNSLGISTPPRGYWGKVKSRIRK